MPFNQRRCGKLPRVTESPKTESRKISQPHAASQSPLPFSRLLCHSSASLLVRAAFGWRLRPPALSPHCSRGSESQSVANKIPSPTRNLETEPYQMPSTRQTPQTGPKRHLKNNTSHKCFRHQSAAIGTSVHSSHAHSGPSAWEAGV